jgi:thiamine-phosphate pyrophosphorylase
MQLCAITDRKQTSQSLLSLVEGWSKGGVDFIQLREKDLDAAALASLAQQLTPLVDHSRSKLLLNVPAPDWATMARAAGADGVHLAGKLEKGAVSTIRGEFPGAIVSVPCHTLNEVDLAVGQGVNLILFSPIFEKASCQVQGLDGLSRACVRARDIPVLALGGVTAANAGACVAAGASGIAAIRLFLGDDWRGKLCL